MCSACSTFYTTRECVQEKIDCSFVAHFKTRHPTLYDPRKVLLDNLGSGLMHGELYDAQGKQLNYTNIPKYSDLRYICKMCLDFDSCGTIQPLISTYVSRAHDESELSE